MADINLKGNSTTASGIFAIIVGALGLAQQILALIQGHALDANAAATSVGSLASGVGLVHAADSKQE